MPWTASATSVCLLWSHIGIHLPNKTLFRSMVLLQTPKNHLRKRPLSVTAPCAFYMNPWEFSTFLGWLVGLWGGLHTHSHFVGRWLVLQPHHLRQVTVVLPVFQRSVPEWLGLVGVDTGGGVGEVESTRGAGPLRSLEMGFGTQHKWVAVFFWNPL